MSAPDAYEFNIDFVNVPEALSGGIKPTNPAPEGNKVAKRNGTPNGTRPHKVTVSTNVKAGKIGPYKLEKVPKARILVMADYRSARNGQPYESPFCDGQEIDIPHFAQDFEFSDADQKEQDWPNYTGPISWTLDFMKAGAKLRKAAKKGEEVGKKDQEVHAKKDKRDLYGLTVTVKARFKDPKGKYHSVTFQDDPVPDTN